MKIDAHHHLWDLGAVSYPWLEAKGVKRFFGDPTSIQRDYLLDEFSADAKRHGFEASVHIQVGAADAMTEARWVQTVAEANPDWPLTQVVFCDLSDPAVGAVLESYADLPSVRGVRQIVGRAPEEDAATGTNALLENPAFLNGLKLAGARGFSFDLQLIPELMDGAARVFAAVPEVQVALCHAGSPHDRSEAGLAFWRQELAKLAALPNVSCKLSGLGMFDHDWTVEAIRPIVESCLELFGAERCLYGSNFPVDSLSSDYTSLVGAYETLLAPLSATERVAIFGGNAKTFYRF